MSKKQKRKRIKKQIPELVATSRPINPMDPNGCIRLPGGMLVPNCDIMGL